MVEMRLSQLCVAVRHCAPCVHRSMKKAHSPPNPAERSISTTNVSYRGNAPALTDIVAGHLPTMFSNLSDALAHLASGAIRALGVSSNKRTPQLPNMPTVAESGFPRLQRDHLERTDAARWHASDFTQHQGRQAYAVSSQPGFRLDYTFHLPS
jgi:hypothetical protein